MIRMLAFIFIRVNTNMSSKVLNQLSKIKCLKEIHELTGDIDVIAKVEATSIEELRKIILKDWCYRRRSKY